MGKNRVAPHALNGNDPVFTFVVHQNDDFSGRDAAPSLPDTEYAFPQPFFYGFLVMPDLDIPKKHLQGEQRENNEKKNFPVTDTFLPLKTGSTITRDFLSVNKFFHLFHEIYFTLLLTTNG
jgi:hypothetical protein